MLGIGTALVALVSFLVASSGFLQDDYDFFELSRVSGSGAASLVRSIFGSIVPGLVFADNVLASGHPISRVLVVIITVGLYALTVFVFYRFLELLFGARFGAVALTTIACTSGLLGISLVWWTPAINSLPAIIADIVAFDGLVRHALTGRRRYLVLSIAAVAFGTMFYDPSMTIVVPLGLFTVLYLADPTSLRSMWRAFWTRWWLWCGYLVPVVANFGWRQTHPAEYALPPVATVSQILRFMGTGWAQGFAPTSIGIDYAALGSGTVRLWVVLLGQVLILGLVAATIVRRRSAWRAWTMFAGSFLIADLLAAIGRASLSTSLALNSLYWCFYGFLFWTAVGLAVLPLRPGIAVAGAAEGEGVRRPRHAHGGRSTRRTWPVAALAAVVLAALGIQYMWSTPIRSLGAGNRSYADNVQVTWERVSSTQPAPFIWDTVAPGFVLGSNFGPYNRLSTTIGLVVPGLRFDQPAGAGYVVDYYGKVIPAHTVVAGSGKLAGSALGNVPVDAGCFSTLHRSTKFVLSLDRAVPPGQWFVRIHYFGRTSVAMHIDDTVVPVVAAGKDTVAPLTLATQTTGLTVGLPKGASGCISADIERPLPNDTAAFMHP